MARTSEIIQGNLESQDSQQPQLKALQPTHFLIAILALCLATVVGLFLYSEYSQPASTFTTQTPLTKTVAPVSIDNSDATTVNPTLSPTNNAIDTPAQPDKALPIPAHQLKKLMADEKKADVLDAKINAANQAIADMDDEIKNVLNRQSAPAATLPTSSTTDDKSQQLNQRIRHIQDHLQQQKTL